MTLAHISLAKEFRYAPHVTLLLLIAILMATAQGYRCSDQILLIGQILITFHADFGKVFAICTFPRPHILQARLEDRPLISPRCSQHSYKMAPSTLPKTTFSKASTMSTMHLPQPSFPPPLPSRPIRLHLEDRGKETVESVIAEPVNMFPGRY